MRRNTSRHRSGEQGQTIILVAISMATLLAMAALAVDVVSLYSARSEAQRSAEAAALAGAQVFASSGFTSGGMAQSLMCNGGTGLAEKAAQAVLAQNPVANGNATATIACDFTNPTTPRITVTAQRTGLPTFFARIWGSAANNVTTTAVAEAFNPSGQTATPVQVTSVMPWLVPNCDPFNAAPAQASPWCKGGGGGNNAYILDPANNYAVANPNIIGRELQLHELRPGQNPTICGSCTGGPSATNGANAYFAVDVTNVPSTGQPMITATSASCPSTAAISGSCTTINSANPRYQEAIACENSLPLSCGQQLSIDPNSGNTLPTISRQGTLCRIHASRRGCNRGQDAFNAVTSSCNNGTSFPPLDIDGGNNNPDLTLRGTNSISRSDSIVSLPIFDGNDPCPGATCGPVTIIGFLQVAINRVRAGGGGGGNPPIMAMITNVSGCGPAPTNNPIAGGPIPVRLVR
jgi:hypothetical protein